MLIKQALRDHLCQLGVAQSSWTDNSLFQKAASEALNDGKITVEKINELLGDAIKSPSPSSVFGGDVRLKKPSERYSTTKSPAKHARTGRPVANEKGQPVETTSELEHFQTGVWLKQLAARGGQQIVMSEHEREGLEQIYAESKFVGMLGGEHVSDIPGSRVKALLSDATSGGTELVPEFFDAAIITYPLLHSELLPRIDLREVGRGKAVEGAAISNPTAVWGIAEGTGIQPFDTQGLVSSLDSTLFPVTVAVEVGRDHISDSAVDVGRLLTEVIGQRILSELDKVIAVGSGTHQPQGITAASGLVDITNPAGGAGADPQVTDFETLMFAIGKQYRTTSNRCCFIANDVSYARARGLAVGASDARRLFGMDESSYKILEHDFVIQNNIPNNFCAFGALARYRMYRRAGAEVRWTSEGRDLTLRNLSLLTVRGRYGARVTDANAFAFSDNWKA